MTQKSFLTKIRTTLQNFAHSIWAFLRSLPLKLHNFLARQLTIEIVRDPDLLHAYAGKNYYKFLTRRFNISGFFFSVLYLLFRKLYVAGVVIFLLDILLINLIRDHVHVILPAFFLGLAVNLALSLLVGFLANEYYLFAIGYKIGRLKVKFPGRSHAELRGICEAKGGTNSLALTVGLLARILSSIVMVINLIFSDSVIILDSSVSGLVKTIRSEAETVITEVQNSLHSAQETIQNTFNHTAQEVETDLKSDAETDLQKLVDDFKRL